MNKDGSYSIYEYHGKQTSISILATDYNGEFNDKLEDLEWIEIKGIIQVYEVPHGDHFDKYPMIEVKELTRISKVKNN